MTRTAPGSSKGPSLPDGSCAPVTLWLDGEALTGPAGVPVAMALYAKGITTLGWNETTGAPRGIYCGIGHCYECRMEIDGVRDQRACLVPLREGMRVRRQDPPDPLTFEAPDPA
jgi:predicted molibdopterin-dependent oxidoreductase YjgC